MKKNKKTRKITFRINDTLYEYLNRAMDETGMEMSELLRNIISDYKRFVGKLKA